jgi:sulfur relay (sulfurtransferase) DsrC/TusE family protein
MEAWVREQLGELLDYPNGLDDLDIHLSELTSQSLKMVTFLSRFNRKFKRCPKIIQFITAPTLKTLKDAIDLETV